MSWTATVTCMASPVQWEGQWFHNGVSRCFYFRGRHSHWALVVGPANSFDGYMQWASQGKLVADGKDENSGWLSEETVRDILEEHFGDCLAFADYRREY